MEESGSIAIKNNAVSQIRAGWQRKPWVPELTYALQHGCFVRLAYWKFGLEVRPLNHIGRRCFGGCMTKPRQYVRKASGWFIYLTVTMFWLIPAFGQTPSTALRFTADGQQVLVPHTDELDLISGRLTIESWVRPDASILSRGYSSIVSKQLNGTGYMTASNLVGPAPGFKAEVAGIEVTSQSRPVAGVWQHVAAVWDGQLKIYVNGQLNGVINTGPPIPNTLPLWIGSSPFGADTNFRGDIDEVRIWAVARSQGEIQSTMNQYLCGDEEGLRAYWSFDEGSGQQLKDTLGRSHGSISGPAWVPGVQLSRRPCPPVSLLALRRSAPARIP